MKKVVLATNNQGKVKELANVLTNFGLTLIGQSDLAIKSIEETGLTFIENAILKARHAAKCSGLPAIADDSGLAVDILGGAPGIYSARYAGENASDAQNIAKLLDDLKDIPVGKRQAQFHCVLVYLRHAEDPTPLVCYGRWPGEIALSPMGNSGFGYDPIFYIPELSCTAAQLDKEEKNRISHRGNAVKQLLDRLANA